MSTPINSNDPMRMFDLKAREAFDALPAEKKEKSLSAKTFILYPFEVEYNLKKPFEEKLEETKRLIKNHLKIYKKIFVATSYGMDSTLMMALIIQCVHELRAEGKEIEMPEFWLNNTLNLFKEEPEYWKQMTALFGIEDKFRIFSPPNLDNGKRATVWSIAERYGHLPNFRRPAGKRSRKTQKIEPVPHNEDNEGRTPECCEILKKATIKDYLKHLPMDERYDCQFIGTRAEESRMRRMAVMQRCRSYMITKRFPYPIRAVTPLSYWTRTTWKDHQGHYEDVWLTHFKNGKRRLAPKYAGKKFVPNPGETAPEDDVAIFYERFKLPMNPAYAIHNMKRMGCASCPAHQGWEKRLASDPTHEGRGMLKQNLIILKKTQPIRYKKSIEALRKTNLVPELIAELENEKTLVTFT